MKITNKNNHSWFIWYVIAAILAIVCVGINGYKRDTFLTICWSIIAACNIYFAWRNS